MTGPDKHNAQTDMMTGRNRRTAVGAAGLAVLMIGAAYAAVPLYDLFCRVTGYGGTTQVATAAPASAATREITIRFDASLNRDMPWSFEAPAQPVQLAIGEQGLAFYEAHNPTGTSITGTATYNVSPSKAGIYFSKIDCFCFTEQVLAPGQRVDMPVSFFVDPEILTDPEMDDVKTITLSYTFFKASESARAEPASPRG